MDGYDQLFAALAKFKEKEVSIPKTKTVTVSGTNKNGKPFSYNYKYAPLDEVHRIVEPMLAACQLVILQPVVCVDGHTFIKTILGHSSGQFIESLTPISAKGEDKDFGGTLTYRRRYAYQSILGLSTEEDIDAVSPGDNRSFSNGYTSSPRKTSAPAKQTSPKKTISEAQRKRMFAIAGEKEVPTDVVKDIVEEFGYESSGDILAKDYDAIVSKIENWEIPY